MRKAEPTDRVVDPIDDPPAGMTWRTVVEHHVKAAGSWVALADELVRRLRLGGDEVPETAAAEKGLRRLATRGFGSGGQYGRWLLRSLGVPIDVEQRLRWLSQYHSRFSDLPTSIRIEHLRLWDRPPISESKLAGWVHVGMASALFRKREPTACVKRLDAASATAAKAGSLATMEIALLRARLASDAGDEPNARALLDIVEDELRTPDLDTVEALCYRARLHGQRAYLLNHNDPLGGNLAIAEQLFHDIPDVIEIPFVAYRRTAGLAYCAWRLGDVERGRALALQAAEHAGDGGFVRFRIMALNMLSRMVDPLEARALRARAARLARAIEDEHLTAVAENKP